MLSGSVEGKVVLITGAASGIGRAIAVRFAQEGAKVAATDQNLDGLPGDATWALDVSDRDAITGVVGEVASRLGPIDVLVNNAGVRLPVPIEADDYFRRWESDPRREPGRADAARARLPVAARSQPGRTHHQHRLDRRARRDAVPEPVHHQQARRRGPHAFPRRRVGARAGSR